MATQTLTVGKYKITGFEADKVIMGLLRNGIMWDSWMLKYFKQYYRPNTDMLDIGGNIGTNALLMSEIISDGNHIHSFEPLYFDILVKNIKDNNKEKVIIPYDYGLGASAYEIGRPMIDLNRIINPAGVSLCFFHDGVRKELGEGSSQRISIKPLDIFNFSNIGLIKIDVEGYEIEVLNGARETIVKNNYPPMIIEIWQWTPPTVPINSENEKLKYAKYYENLEKNIITLLFEIGYTCVEVLHDHDYLFTKP